VGPLVIISLLAAAPGEPAAASGWYPVAAPGGVANLARSAGLQPDLPRWRALFEITRRLHPTYGEMSGSTRALKDVASYLDSVKPLPGSPAGDASARRPSAASTEVVPLPLGPEAWRRSLFRQASSDEAVVGAILRSRPASLLYRGLVQLDEETLGFLAQHADILADLSRVELDAFSVFAGSWRVRNGRVAVPGGEEAAPLWEGALGEKVSRPGRFLQKLVTRDSGRLFFFYDVLDGLDAARQRFALGLVPGSDRSGQVFKTVREAFSHESTWWKPGWGSFSRASVDAGLLLREVRVLPSGEMAPPASRVFWRAVFGEGPGSDKERVAVDAAYLTQRIATGPPDTRRTRLDQLRLAQRVFADVPPALVGEAVTAVKGLEDRSALVYMLERMGFTDPVLYAEALRASHRFDRLEGEAHSRALAQFQGVLLILDRARFRRTLDLVAVESLLRWLFAVPVTEHGEFEGRIAAWLTDSALPVLAEAVYGGEAPGSAEVVVGRAISGAVLARGEAPPFEWEGLYYHADPGLADLERFDRVRERSGGNSLEPVLAFCRAARDKEPLASRLPELRTIARELGPPAFPETLEEPPPPREVVEEAAREAGRNGGEERANALLVRAGDALLADALLAIAYAPHVGDDPGEALPGGNVARRHVFGAAAWQLAGEKIVPGQRWHVQGALPGLDLGLARLQLRRLSPEAPTRPPGIDTRTRLAFAQGAALMNPFELDDRGRDAVAAAIRRGRERMRQLRGDGAALRAVAREAGLDAFRRSALPFVVARDPSALPEFFSLGELFRLGAPEARGDAWGAPAIAEGGGWLLRMPPPRSLDDFAGMRLDDLLAARLPDLALRAAADLSSRRLPGSLAPGLLSYVITDFAEEVEPIGHDDWLALSRYLLDMKPARVDDYVAALAGDGPLRPAAEPEATP
jgi:hypothetical protein